MFFFLNKNYSLIRVGPSARHIALFCCKFRHVRIGLMISNFQGLFLLQFAPFRKRSTSLSSPPKVPETWHLRSPRNEVTATNDRRGGWHTLKPIIKLYGKRLKKIKVGSKIILSNRTHYSHIHDH